MKKKTHKVLHMIGKKAMDPRWKHKTFADIAKSNPISQITKQLKSSLALSNSQAILSGRTILFEATSEISSLLKCLCFGHTIVNNQHLFEFNFEEAFYLHHSLKSLNITTPNSISSLTEAELWDSMKSIEPAFPEYYKAYAHLRDKNWVVKKMTKYGGDFVAYRHHPKLIHSEYAVLVMIEDDDDDKGKGRFKDWSDFQCRLRVSGSVAKELLVLSVNKNTSDTSLPLCLEKFSVEESRIARWVPEECRENADGDE